MATRYGGLIFRESSNLGDYVQAIAAEQFLPRVDCYLDRDHLNEFSGPRTKAILNGWYMHKPEHWPPPQNIDPLLISIHLNHDRNAHVTMLRPEILDYYRAHGPIGCRDLHTLELFQDAGVEAYFSGCLTLTLQRDPAWRRRDDLVLFVDVFDDVRPFRGVDRLIQAATHRLRAPRVRQIPLRDAVSPDIQKRLLPDLARDGVLVSNEDHIESSSERRYQMTRNLLELFGTARAVVTSRLHCALPCLAYGTPVVFVDPEHEREWRFGGLSPYLRRTTREQFLDEHTDWDWGDLKNPGDITPLAASLRKRCESFIESD